LGLGLAFTVGEAVVGERVGNAVDGAPGILAQVLNPGKHFKSKQFLHSGEASFPSLQNWKQF
jgi:hypothetical protein